METYGYLGLIDNKIKTLIQLPWVPIYTNTERLIEVETNNKVKNLISQSQRKAATIFKTPIELPLVSIYNDTDILYSFLKLEYKHKFLITLSQRRSTTILKTLIK